MSTLHKERTKREEKTLLSPEAKKPKVTSDQDLKLEIIKDAANPSALHVTEKTTQLNVLDRLKQPQKEANETNQYQYKNTISHKQAN